MTTDRHPVERPGGGAIHFAALPPAAEVWTQALPVLQQLRPHLTPESLSAVLHNGSGQGLRYVGAFDQAGACLGLAGWRVVDNTSAGRKLYVDDLVTTAAARSRGVGRRLLEHLQDQGRSLGCRLIELDSGVTRFDAHRFYLREHFTITAHHFSALL